MDAIANVSGGYFPATSSLRRPSILTPLSFRPVQVPSSSSNFKIKHVSIKCSSSSSSSFSVSNFLLSNNKIPKLEPVETLIQSPNPIIRTALVAAVTALAVFSSRFSNRPVLAAPIAPPATVESISTEAEAKSLRAQIELNIKDQKLPEALQLLDKLIQIQPTEVENRILRGEMLSYNGDTQSAKAAFREIINTNPLQLEAYHGLLMTAARTESTEELDEVNGLLEKAMKLANGEKLRGFMLMYAQLRVLAGDLKESMRIYNELINENVLDFRPYLFKGVIHTVMNQKEEAEKAFEKYKSLIPDDHPFAKQCDENILATQLMFQASMNVEEDQK